MATTTTITTTTTTATFGSCSSPVKAGAYIPSQNGSITATKQAVCCSVRTLPPIVATRTKRISCRISSSSRLGCKSNNTIMASTTTETEKLGIKIVKNPPESKLSELGVRSWPKWGCPPSKFPWTYSSRETCYILEGKVKVYPEGSDEAVEVGGGDLVVFPKGMSCTWDVSVAVDKHYKFD